MIYLLLNEETNNNNKKSSSTKEYFLHFAEKTANTRTVHDEVGE